MVISGLDASGDQCEKSSMDVGRIRKRLNGGFQPFTIQLSNGKHLHVPHPDFMLIPPIGETVIVVDQEGGKHIVDADHITKLELRQARPAKPSR